MSALLRLVALLVVFLETLDAYRMVAAPVGSCTKKRASGVFLTAMTQCNTLGGQWRETPTSMFPFECRIDWCDVPINGTVATGYVWGIDMDQDSTTSSQTRTDCVMKMLRRDCDLIYGNYTHNPTPDKMIYCQLFFTRRSGSDSKNVNTLVLSSVDESDNKVAKGIIPVTNRECLQIGGEWNGNPGAKDVIDCYLDICISPVIQCEPSDIWTTIQTCRNPSSSTFTCSFRLNNGIEKTMSSTSRTGSNTSMSITTEVSAQLMKIFTTSVKTTFTTGFHWSTTVGSIQTWSKALTRTLEVALDGGKAITIKQVVGQCGDFRVDTYEYRVIDIPLY